MVTTAVEARPTTRGRSLVTALFSARTPPTATDVLLIVVRATLAFLFIYHGARRFGWLGGASLDQWGTFFADTAGLEPGKFFAVLGGIIELGGGIAIAFGFLTRLAGLAIFGDMMMAIITVEWDHGLNSTGGNEGYELNLALGVLALVVGILGAGRVSVDALVEQRLLEQDASASPAS